MALLEGVIGFFPEVPGVDLTAIVGTKEPDKERIPKARLTLVERIFGEFYFINHEERKGTSDSFYLSNKIPSEQGEDLIVTIDSEAVRVKPAGPKYGNIHTVAYLRVDESKETRVVLTIPINGISPKTLIEQMRDALVEIRGLYSLLNAASTKVRLDGKPPTDISYRPDILRLTGFAYGQDLR